MQKRTEDYCLTVDSLTEDGCSGWYVRRDKKAPILILNFLDTYLRLSTKLKRPDVAASGEGNGLCGFSISFPSPLPNGEKITFNTPDGEKLLEMKIPERIIPAEALNLELIGRVEPFIEMDMAKVRARLFENKIFEQYKRIYNSLLPSSIMTQLSPLIDVLADIKTTMHILSAAYLDQARYKDPDFIKSLPHIHLNYPLSLQVDMRGDITGRNWQPAEEDGRWAGPEAMASLLLPPLLPGKYEIKFEITGENLPCQKDSVQIEINGEIINLESGDGHVELKGYFRMQEEPFLAINFYFKENVKDKDVPVYRFKLKTVTIAERKAQ